MTKKTWAIGIGIPCAFLVIAGYEFQSQLKKSISSGYFVVTLASWSEEARRQDQEISEEAILDIIHAKGTAAFSHYADRFEKFPVILDFWGTPLRHSKLDDQYEWRSAGQDLRFGTKDDRVFHYQMNPPNPLNGKD